MNLTEKIKKKKNKIKFPVLNLRLTYSMSPSPKIPDENKLPNEETSSSNDELSHPPSHLNNEYVASTDESNSEDETNPTNGYCLLPQDTDANQPDKPYDTEDEEEEFRRFATLRAISTIDDEKAPPINNNSSLPIGESIWSTKVESESFPVDDDKANYIKTRMLDIQLPQSSIPVWAQYCSENDWQEKLRERIICRQTTFFSDDKK